MVRKVFQMRLDQTTDQNMEALAKLTGTSKTKAVKEAIVLALRKKLDDIEAGR
jgi:hypothetical protein